MRFAFGLHDNLLSEEGAVKGEGLILTSLPTNVDTIFLILSGNEEGQQ